jgi:hypothetical protein
MGIADITGSSVFCPHWQARRPSRESDRGARPGTPGAGAPDGVLN